MSARLLSHLTIFLLLLVGSFAIWTRHIALKESLNDLEDSRWRLSYDLSFQSVESPTKIRIAIPDNNELVSIEAQPSRIVPDMAKDLKRLIPSRTREMVVSTNDLGEYNVALEYDLRLRLSAEQSRTGVLLTPKQKNFYLREEKDIPVNLTVVKQILETMPSEYKTEEQKVEWIFNYCLRELERVPVGTSSDSVFGSLVNGAATPVGRAMSMVTLSRAAGFPARRVIGFELRHQTEAQPHTWIEIFKGNRWIPFDPERGYARQIPKNYLPVRYGASSIIRSVKATNLKVKYSLAHRSPADETLEADKPNLSQILDLTRLPVQLHEVLSLLLLLPFGALITAFCRNVIGIRTFGTFAPALMAVSFIYADVWTGILVLAMVFIAGFFSRLLVDRLRLLLVPRLSILLTTIILFVVAGVSTMEYWSPNSSSNAVLLPMVILTILIERCYVTIEEDGPVFAIQLVVGTFLVSSLCYFLLRWDEVGQAILIYPEIHLLTIAAFVAIGRYTGYRVVEMFRFRDVINS